MFKIKLLILLLINTFLVSCTSDYKDQNNIKFDIGTIQGEYDGLVLNNLLSTYLKNFNLYSKDSIYEIQANISHSSNLFITNIDNTSDRESLTSGIALKIYNKKEKCFTFSYKNEVDQFFIYASSDKFLSNQKAIEKIKQDNTEVLVKKFLNAVLDTEQVCNV